jgi:hypothetical protein
VLSPSSCYEAINWQQTKTLKIVGNRDEIWSSLAQNEAAAMAKEKASGNTTTRTLTATVILNQGTRNSATMQPWQQRDGKLNAKSRKQQTKILPRRPLTVHSIG